mgnify:CR=1 FL=1
MSAQNTTSDFSPTHVLSEGLSAPGRMAVDADDNVYVTDAIQKSIVKYDAQANLMGTITTDFNPISIAINNKNHLFQTSETGSVSEYNKIEETMSPEVLAYISNWILSYSKNSMI